MVQERDIFKDIITAKDIQIANLNKEIELEKRIIEIKDMEIAATNRALKQMEAVADKAIKLAEVGKPKPDFKLWGMVIALFALLALSL